MATGSSTKKPCCKCDKGGATFTCDGCRQSFCLKHASDHREELSQQIDNIGQQHDILKRDIDQQSTNETLLAQIGRWEEESIAKIRFSAAEARTDLKRLTEESKSRLNGLLNQLSNELRRNREDDSFTENDISQWMKQLEKLRKDLSKSSEFQLIEKDDCPSLRFIMINGHDTVYAKNKSSKMVLSSTLSQNSYASTDKSELSTETIISSSSESSSYPCITFGPDLSSDLHISFLFEYLMTLFPMNKNGPMNGRCSPQTHQMERFLFETFGFRNITGEYIVQGVKSFRLDRYPRHMDPKTTIYFPSDTTDSFAMTVQEIIEWQRSYRVYAYKDIKGMDKAFLRHALQGQSGDGEEAFLMKFVIRISTCPILMEFDAKMISRKLNEDWPHRIKLVSVTGIDFAGRKHDVCDILAYILNWKDIYEIDPKSGLPSVYNGRDFRVRREAPPVKLHEDLLLKDLMHMARLRLRACDAEGVQIVVETGIGLGVFSGKHIGIDGKVRLSSALAIRTVLEEEGSKFKNIRAIVFALPIIDETNDSGHVRHCFSDFVDQFQEPQYNGTIPILIADQDMHRLTVAIARHGFVVSQLNPADSHGVFGECWQNRGPAVEGKLALTTVGLLVQHHLINPHVLDPNNYYLV
jgi:hypothetical protein